MTGALTNQPPRHHPTAQWIVDRDELLRRASLRTARFIRGVWEEKGGRSHSRLLDGLFIPRELVRVGESLACTPDDGRDEHVIPLKVVIEWVHGLLDRDEDDEAVAALIREHVKVVRVSKAEAEKLDRKVGVGLRQKMRDGWSIGDDPFDRLTLAGIRWKPVEPT